ncbi:VCBS domain-containing protein [Vibrio aestuarianus]|uniref:VCBS domain-containing protein n=1 Tax=Vibrio aestuarianus TaxID=28171 RepID=UPI002469BD86|nr:VCBS domain-containing protein [Vibrio aestuarianus]MDH5981872.1 VCBS domain-containing protein [Vibrio aestuarianus]
MVEQSKLTAETYVVIGLDGHIKVVKSKDNLLPGEVIVETLKGEIQPQQVDLANVEEDPKSSNFVELNKIYEALEQGVDPTELGDEYATAQGEIVGSSLTKSGTIERTGAEVLASTFFETASMVTDLTTEQGKTVFNIARAPQSEPTETKAIITPTQLDGDKGAVQEDVLLESRGNLNIVDSDAGEAVFQPQTDVKDGNWGTFSIDKSGNWTYKLNNSHADVQALDADSAPLTRTMTVTSADGSTHDVVITITGSDDKAIITPTQPDGDKGAVQEDVLLESRGNLNIVDPDAGEAVFHPQTDVKDGTGALFLSMRVATGPIN